jgi:hypothetical protein
MVDHDPAHEIIDAFLVFSYQQPEAMIGLLLVAQEFQEFFVTVITHCLLLP